MKIEKKKKEKNEKEKRESWMSVGINFSRLAMAEVAKSQAEWWG